RADVAGTDFFAVVHVGVVDDAETVALAQVFQEVDAAAQDVHHFHGDRIRDLGLVGGAEQGAGDFAFGDAGFADGGGGAFLGGETTVGGPDFEPGGNEAGFFGGARRMGIAQPHHPALFVQGGLHGAAGVELVDGPCPLVVRQEGQQAVFVHPQAVQQVGHRVAAADAGRGDVGRGLLVAR